MVSETSQGLNTAHIFFVSRPSGTEVTLAGGAGPSAMVLRGQTLYFAVTVGD